MKNRSILMAIGLVSVTAIAQNPVMKYAMPAPIDVENERCQGADKAMVLQKVAARGEYPDNWASIGWGEYTEDVFTTYLNIENDTWAVEIEENRDFPGVYRLVHPYSNGRCPFKLTTGGNDYIVLDARNPLGVVLEKSNLDASIGLGNVTLGCWAEYYLSGENGETPATLEEQIKIGNCGKLYDGNITFEKTRLTIQMSDYNEGVRYYANYNRRFRVRLPGGKDYSLKLESPHSVADATKHPVDIHLGKDFAKVRYLFKKAFDNTNEYGDNDRTYWATHLHGKDFEGGSRREIVDLVAAGGRGKYLFAMVCLNGIDSIVEKRVVNLYYNPDEESEWVSHGMTSYRDDFFGSIYTEIGTQGYKVELQTNVKYPGVYRLVNPYDEKYEFMPSLKFDTSHNHYMYVHAEDPNYCYIDETPVGVTAYGDVRLSSTVSLWLSYGNPLEAIKRFAAYMPLFGKLNETTRTITFDPKILLYSDSKLIGGQWIEVNTHNGFKLVVPESAAVDEIMIDDDNAVEEYYLLNGMRTKATSLTPGLYIRKKGLKVEKILVN